MSAVHFNQATTLTPEQFIAELTDLGPGRSAIFGKTADDDLGVFSQDATEADVKEGSKGVCERLHYDGARTNP